MLGALWLLLIFAGPVVLLIVASCARRRVGLVAAGVGFLAGVVVLARLGDKPAPSGAPVDGLNFFWDLERIYGGALVLGFGLVLAVRMLRRPREPGGLP